MDIELWTRIGGETPVGHDWVAVARGIGETVRVRKQYAVAPRLIIALVCFFCPVENAQCESAARTDATVRRDAISPTKIVKRQPRAGARRVERRTGGKANKQASSTVRQDKVPVVARKMTGAKPLASMRREDSSPKPAAGEHGVADADACQQQLRNIFQPVKLIRMAEECERLLPEGALVDEIRRIASGARSAMEAQRLAGMTADLFEDSVGDGPIQELIAKAVRGDMDAAFGIAQAYRSGKSGTEQNLRRMEQWLLFSAELGNGRASWELAEHYNYGGLVSDAARFEKKAIDLGFRPPLRLPSRGY